MKRIEKSWKRRTVITRGLLFPLLLFWWLASLRSWLPRTLPVKASFYALAASPRSSLLVCSSNGGWIQMWDTQTRRLLWEKLTSGSVEKIIFSPDGQQVVGFVSGVKSGTKPHIRIWEASTGRQLQQMPVQTRPQTEPVKLCFTQNGRILLFQTGEDRLDRFEIATGRKLLPLDLSAKRLLAQQPNNPKLRSLRTPMGEGIGRKISIVDIAPGALLVVVQVVPMGTTLSEEHWLNRDQTWVCDERGHLRFALPQTDGQSGRLSSNGRWLALYGFNGQGSATSVLQIWDVRTGRLVNTLPYRSLDVTITRDGKRLFVVHSGSSSQQVSIYDIKTRRELRHLEAATPQIGTTPLFTLSHDEATFILTEEEVQNAAIRLWRVK